MNKSLKIALRVGYGLLAAVIVVVSIAMVLRAVDIEGTLDYILGIGDDSGNELLEYELLDDDTYMVVGISEDAEGDIYIPSEYNGKAVTAIGENAFRNCDYITSVTIPDSIEYIYRYAFASCDLLTDIYCEVYSEPEGWSSNWNYGCDATIHWCDQIESF